MSSFYHILGSDIPHHNATFLAFFNQYLAKKENPPHFLVVSQNKDMAEIYPHLQIKIFPNKKAICFELIKLSLKNRHTKFIFYGQFNPYIWLAMWLKLIPIRKHYWHIWGADLYETSHQFKFQLLYFIRRKIQKNFKQIWATQGDLNYIQQHLKRHTTLDKRVYFPTKMQNVLFSDYLQRKTENEPLVVLLGNSGDPSNQHLKALHQLKETLGENIRLIIPMGYPIHNDDYIKEVRETAYRLFPQNQIELLTENLAFEQYQHKLRECDLAYFIFERQQAIGSICLLIQMNIPLVFSPKNPFTTDLIEQAVPFILESELNIQKVYLIKQQLIKLNKAQIAFFFPNYIQIWQALLDQVSP